MSVAAPLAAQGRKKEPKSSRSAETELASAPPERVEEVDGARWSPSLGFKAEGPEAPSQAPASGGVLLGAPPANATAAPAVAGAAAAEAGAEPAAAEPAAEAAAESTAEPELPGRVWVEVGPRISQPTAYGSGDALLNQAGIWFEAGLGTAPRLGELMGITFDVAASGGSTSFGELTVTTFDPRVTCGPFVHLLDDRLRLGLQAHLGFSVVTSWNSAETIADDALNGFGGLSLYTRWQDSGWFVEPAYRWNHTGVDAHYLAAKLGLALGSLELYLHVEQRIAAMGGVNYVAGIDNFSNAYFQAAPTKTVLALGLGYRF